MLESIDNKEMSVIIFAFFLVMIYYRSQQRGSEYARNGSYKNVSPLKHDLLKETTLQLIPLLFFTLGRDKLYDSDKPLNSILGKVFVGLLGYSTYYLIIEPYIANKTPIF
jgi:hypothetical protein